MHNFVLAYVFENTFWDNSYASDSGEQWLAAMHGEVHRWLTENAIEYRVHFDYLLHEPSHKTPMRIRMEIPNDNDAVNFRLSWS
jgi:hypothetical protein